MLWVVSRGLPEHPQAPAVALGANEHCARAAHVTTAAPPDGRLPVGTGSLVSLCFRVDDPAPNLNESRVARPTKVNKYCNAPGARVKQAPAKRVGDACRSRRGGAGPACGRCGRWSWARKLATESKCSVARARGLRSAVHDRGRTFSGHSRQPGGGQHDGAHHETHPPGTPKHATSIAYGTPSRTAAV